MNKLAVVLGCLVMGGCVTTKPIVSVYNPAEYEKYHKAGTAEIKGQAFLKTAGGDVKFAAGETVTLIPGTAYSEEIISFYQNYMFIRPEGVDPRWGDHQKSTIADGSGNFEFTGLPAGVYYLECPIYWMVPAQYGAEQTGQTVYKKIDLHDGEKIKVVLTD